MNFPICHCIDPRRIHGSGRTAETKFWGQNRSTTLSLGWSGGRYSCTIYERVGGWTSDVQTSRPTIRIFIVPNSRFCSPFSLPDWFLFLQYLNELIIFVLSDKILLQRCLRKCSSFSTSLYLPQSPRAPTSQSDTDSPTLCCARLLHKWWTRNNFLFAFSHRIIILF